MKMTKYGVWLAALTYLPSASQATIVKDTCIANIAEILADLPAEGHTVAALDWDRTISIEEGGEELRDKDKNHGTLAVLNILHEKGIKTMVLTARYGGYGLDHVGFDRGRTGEVRELLPIAVDAMKKALEGTNWIEYGALKTNNLEAISMGGDTMLITDQMAFAGGDIGKGNALKKLSSDDKFKVKPNNIIFVENSSKRINEVRNAFKHNQEINVYLFHYPQPTGNTMMDIDTGDMPCTIK